MTQVGTSNAVSGSSLEGQKPQQELPVARKPRLLEQLHQALRCRHYSRRTEQTYCQWVKRFIYFHKVRHPAEMAEPEINAFLNISLSRSGSVPRHRTRPSVRCCFFIDMFSIGRSGILAK